MDCLAPISVLTIWCIHQGCRANKSKELTSNLFNQWIVCEESKKKNL